MRWRKRLGIPGASACDEPRLDRRTGHRADRCAGPRELGHAGRAEPARELDLKRGGAQPPGQSSPVRSVRIALSRRCRRAASPDRGRGVGQSCPGRGAPGGWALSLIPNTWLGCTPSAHRGSGCVAGTAPAFFFDHDQSGQLQDQVGLLASSATAASTGLSPARSSR